MSKASAASILTANAWFACFVGWLASGCSAPQASPAPTPREIALELGASWSREFMASDVLELESRIAYSTAGGAEPVLLVLINGKRLDAPLVNKGQTFKYADGRTFAYLVQTGEWESFLSPDFSRNNLDAAGGYQVVSDAGEAYRYKWDISKIVASAATMSVAFKHQEVVNAVRTDLIIRLLAPSSD